jgi:DNA helicase IV / RNA helicase N terminal
MRSEVRRLQDPSSAHSSNSSGEAESTSVEPLLTLRQSRLYHDESSMRPKTLRIYRDRVECTKPGLLSRGSTITVPYEQIAQVAVQRGVAWSALEIKTSGGSGFVVNGLPRAEADAAKAEIDARVAAAHGRQAPHGLDVGFAHQLGRLARLREEGLLSEWEFLEAKAALFRAGA